jgi:cell division protein FtsB
LNEWLRFRGRDPRNRSDDDPGDARRVAEAARRPSPDPEAVRRVKLRRRALVLGLGGVCLAGSVAAVLGEGGYVDMLRLRAEIASMQADIEQYETEVDRLQSELHALREDPLALERIAREQLGLVRRDEIDFLLPKEGDGIRPAAPLPDAADPRP